MMEQKYESILLEAESIVNGARNVDYGSAKVSFTKIGAITGLILTKDEWNNLAVGIFPDTVVAKVLISTKLTRESFAHKRDNLVDLAGYTDLLNKIVEE